MVGRKWSGIRIVPDAKYPRIMWRVEYPDGTLSEMVNRARAKDVAVRLIQKEDAADRGGGRLQSVWRRAGGLATPDGAVP
jgi:hypothetical protein